MPSFSTWISALELTNITVDGLTGRGFSVQGENGKIIDKGTNTVEENA
jgi:hypothetical protein